MDQLKISQSDMGAVQAKIKHVMALGARVNQVDKLRSYPQIDVLLENLIVAKVGKLQRSFKLLWRIRFFVIGDSATTSPILRHVPEKHVNMPLDSVWK